jgi:prevent-host-death family protein
MKRVGLFAAKTHLSQLVDGVRRNRDRVIIQSRGKDVAVLGPLDDPALPKEERADWIMAEIDRLLAKQPPPPPGQRIKDLITEGRKR